MYQNQNDILLSVLVSLIILSVILLFFIITVIRLINAEKRATLRHCAAIVAFEERIKEKLAAELHDEFGASLAAITVNLQNIRTTDKVVMAALQKTEAYIAGISPRLRNIFHDLLPPQLEKYGLRTSVYNLIEEADKGSLKVKVSLAKRPPPKDIQLHIYRIIQELFTNVLKHASATECIIELEDMQNKFLLRIKDNGKGFNEKHYRQKNMGIGLINVYYRTELLKGTISLNTAPGKGTEYIFEIPYLWLTKK